MDNKTPINTLAASISLQTGKSKKLCEDFLKEYFRLVSEALETGDTVKIKGFGTFKTVEVDSRMAVNVNTGERQEIAAHRKVVFTPSKELASEINAPFIDFESVEIEEEDPEEIFYEQPEEFEETIENKVSQEEEKGDENLVSTERLEVGSAEEGEDDDITYEAYNAVEDREPVPSSEPESKPAPEPSSYTAPKYEPAPEPEPIILPVYDDDEETKSRFGIGFLTGALCSLLVCVVIFMLGCFFDWWPINFGNAKEITEQVIQNEEAPTVEEEIPEEKEPVYDTVSTTRYLTTIAREHYGDFNFWPYIYIENQGILGHPDRITPGTRVVVPDLSKYGVSPDNKADVEEAKKKGLEIYARYK